MRLPSLILSLFLALPAAALSQTTGGADLPESVAELMQVAESTESGERFAAAIGELVRRTNERPAQAGAATVALLTEIIRTGSQMKRAIAVDALKSLPEQSRQQIIPVLTDLVEGGGDTARTRLFVRGLGESGPRGVAALRQLLEDGQLTGEAASRARQYTRG